MNEMKSSSLSFFLLFPPITSWSYSLFGAIEKWPLNLYTFLLLLCSLPTTFLVLCITYFSWLKIKLYLSLYFLEKIRKLVFEFNERWMIWYVCNLCNQWQKENLIVTDERNYNFPSQVQKLCCYSFLSSLALINHETVALEKKKHSCF